MGHPESTIFHHSAWASVILDRYRCQPVYYVLENERGEISAAAPFLRLKSPLTGKRIVCLPSSEFCFPLAYREEDLGELMAVLKQEVDGEHSSYLEVRGWGSLGTPGQFGFKEHSYYLTHIIDLDGDPQKVRARMDRNGRYNLRYSEKSPITVRIGQGEDDLKEFYRLAMATRRRHNLLPQPYRLFQSIYRHVIVPGHGYIHLAELNGKVIAANMYFCFKDTVTHEFNAQDENYFEYRPNYLLIWKAIERACQESYHHYHFGRTHPENQPLATFKRHWGSREATLSYCYYPTVRGTSSVSQSSVIYRAYTTVNRLLPRFLMNFAGEFMFRHMG
jgi:lipid II:glycine glycyltransferase (peptidoglycan interpeptide bridge formation enzyme)